MKYKDLRDFVAQLEARGELRRITAPVDPNLEMTEVCDRVLRAGGPADFTPHRDGLVIAPLNGAPIVCESRR